MSKAARRLAVIVLAFITAFSFFYVPNIPSHAEESGIFTYYVSGSNSVLSGISSSAAGEITVPETLGGYPVITIDGAFRNKTKITSVVLPDTVTVINSNSFSYCSQLKNIRFSDNLRVIGENAFGGCSSLQSIQLPDTVTNVGAYAFSWCERLVSVKLSNSMRKIERALFSGCTSLENIEIPDSVNYIAHSAFYQTKYYETSDNWEGGVLYIDSHLVTAKNTVSGLYEVKPGTKTIAENAFSVCGLLTGVILYKEIRAVCEGAFNGCGKLTDVYYEGTVVDRGSINVGNNNNSYTNALWHYEYDPNEKEYAPGDINGDEAVNNKDALRLFKYFSGWDVEVIESVLDVNGDKTSNNKDFIRLFQYLSGWDVKIYSKHVGAEFGGDDQGPVIVI